MARNREINSLVKKLQEKKIGFYGVPEEYISHPKIAKIERELGIRKTICKGYDIIQNVFFVDELIGQNCQTEFTSTFDSFATYYEFLEGDIYGYACYYRYNFSQEEIKKYHIDLNRINFSALIDYTIDEFSLNFSKEERKQYRLKENRKKSLIRGIAALNTCANCDELIKQLSLLSEFVGIPQSFFLSNFIFHDKRRAFNIVMEYINLNNIQPLNLAEKMCLIYDPQEVLAHFNALSFAPSTVKKYKKQLEQFIDALENGRIQLKERTYFDEETHFFVYLQIGLDDSDAIVVEFRRYFATFDSLMEFRENILSYCDLTKAIMPNTDFSKYKIGDHAYLPIQYQTNLVYSLKKEYSRGTDKFIVEQTWKNQHEVIIKQHRHTFKHFFDFVYFLKGDLCNADLLFCDGFAHLCDFTGLKLDNIRARSEILAALGIRCETEPIAAAESFAIVQQNEEDSVEVLMAEREKEDLNNIYKRQKVYYISDLHLLHRLNNAHCKSAEDVIYTIQKIIDAMLDPFHRWEKNIVLIGGDTSSDISIFNKFVCMLKNEAEICCPNIKFIFTLGNHELWAFPHSSFEETCETYHDILFKNGMFLMQNNILFTDDYNNIIEISEEELNDISAERLKCRLNKARIILFGGLAFAGYNESFNANQLIYRAAINRQQEIEATKKFETLYYKICADLSDKRMVIFTHTPQKDWCNEPKPKKNFVYVSSHTHRNYFYDDGELRAYADNQIGYKGHNVHLKYFYIADDYDLFSGYADGIYEISREEYIDFYRGKNIQIAFNREFYKLFMLKKHGYYMFILQYPSGNLTILNGGALKSLQQKDVNYYFERMDEVISYIKKPLDKFTEYQKKIALSVKTIGGLGTIHGAIVDIDFTEHIYVNPIDLSVTPYSAANMIWKRVYSDIPTLLQHNCPELYSCYLHLLESRSSKITALCERKEKNTTADQLYLDTDIYRASMEIAKMQKLSSNILSMWIEPTTKKLPSS